MANVQTREARNEEDGYVSVWIRAKVQKMQIALENLLEEQRTYKMSSWKYEIFLKSTKMIARLENT